MRIVKDTWQVVVVLAAALVLAITPAAAQEESGVSCEPAQTGETMRCTATGLDADGGADWTATFGEGLEDDPVVEEGTVTADGDGVAEFDVEVPEDTQPGEPYEVRVTGTDAEGNDYDESTQGLVAPADGGDGDGNDGNGNGDVSANAASAGVSCGEAVAGQTMTCETAGLEADSEAQWAVFFNEDLDTADQGSAVADAEGAAAFDIDLIDDEGAPYRVRVTGTAADGDPYDETVEGVIVAADDDPVADDDGDAAADDDQVSPTPKGGADAGMGGTAASSVPGGPAALLAGLGLLAAAAAVASRSRDVPATIRRRFQELRARG